MTKRYSIEEIYLLFFSVIILSWHCVQYLTPYAYKFAYKQAIVFLVIAIVTFIRPRAGLAISVFLLPFLTGISLNVNILFKRFIPFINVWALDICCGLIFGLFANYIRKKISYGTPMDEKLPGLWIRSIALVQLFLVVSTIISIGRRISQTSTNFTIKGFIYNISLVRTLGWHDDFFPLTDLLLYSAGLLLFLLLVRFFRENHEENPFKIVAPLIYANFLIVAYGVIQYNMTIGFYNSKDRGVNSFFMDIHSLGEFELICLVICLAGLIMKMKPGLLFASGYIVACLGLVISGSRSSMLFLPILSILTIVLLARNIPKKIIVRASLLIFITCVITGAIFLKTNSGQYLINSLSLEKLSSGNFDTLNIALSERPEIWKASLSMFTRYPVLGLGMGNFFRSSSIEGFSTSKYFLAIRGENAHNFFIQSLAEFGVLGSIILLTPFFFLKSTKNESKIVISIITAFFFGNIYNLQFLNRESLIIFIVILAYLFATGDVSTKIKFFWNNFIIKKHAGYKIALCAGIFAIAFAVGIEVYRSFSDTPFTYASLCGQFTFNKTPDNWVPSKFEHTISGNHAAIIVRYNIANSSIEKRPVRFRYGIRLRGKDTEIGMIDVTDQQTHSLKIVNVYPLEKDVKYYFETDCCFVPLSWGTGHDTRRLGLNIEEIKVETK